jgi:hypothetical protein
MNDSWCVWFIPVCEGLRNGPYCLRCCIYVSFVSRRSDAFFRVMCVIVSRPDLLPFYILDPWFPATISSSSNALTDDLDHFSSVIICCTTVNTLYMSTLSLLTIGAWTCGCLLVCLWIRSASDRCCEGQVCSYQFGWEDHSCCVCRCSLGFSLLHFFFGVPAASVVGGCAASPSANWHLQHVGVEAVFPFPGQSLCRWHPPHHKQRGRCLQLAQTWPNFWQL